MIPTHTTDDQGRVWSLHAIEFDSDEGQRTMYVHALSIEHAAALLQDLRQSRPRIWQVTKIVPLGDGVWK